MQSLQCISLSDGRTADIPQKSVVCLGNFDGVHLGHRALLTSAKELRARLGEDVACAVLCFRAPSSDFLGADKPAHLCTLGQKLQLFRACGMDYAFLIDFPEIRGLSPEEFARRVLRDACHVAAVVCGFNYRFGKGGVGTPETLKSLLDVEVAVRDEVCADGETVSSTRIRNLLREGRPSEAARLLTRPYAICSEVVHGKALGKTWGFPTLNQNFPSEMLIPRHGVYITDCELDGRHYRGVSNVGAHPTVDSAASVNCETYLLDFDGDAYGKTVTVCFLEFLRPEQKFDSEETLRAQIARDIQAARQY